MSFAIWPVRNRVGEGVAENGQGCIIANLRQGFEEHLEQTQPSRGRLEQIFEQLGTSSRGDTCDAMKDDRKKVKKMIDEDANLTSRMRPHAAAQRVDIMKSPDTAPLAPTPEYLPCRAEQLLQQTLDEKRNQRSLDELAETEVNANQSGGLIDASTPQVTSITGGGGLRGLVAWHELCGVEQHFLNVTRK